MEISWFLNRGLGISWYWDRFFLLIGYYIIFKIFENKMS